MRRKVAFIGITFAIVLYLLHAAIPHHHHHSVCFFSSRADVECCSDAHTHEATDSHACQHDTEECGLLTTFSVMRDEFSLSSLQPDFALDNFAIYCYTDYYDVITIAPPLTIHSPFRVFNTPLCSLYYGLNCALRAPPTA